MRFPGYPDPGKKGKGSKQVHTYRIGGLSKQQEAEGKSVEF